MGVYLDAYNFIQFLGWSAINILTLASGTFSVFEIPLVSNLLKFFQTLMLLDVILRQIVHGLLKISGSPVAPSFFQVVGRNLVVYCFMDLNPSVCFTQSSWIFGVSMMWSTSEMIRYSSYLAQSFKITPKWLMWLRYSVFIVIYPIGVFSEVMVFTGAYPKIAKCCPRVFSYEMPNEYNFSFDFLYFLVICVLPGYVLGFPFLYTYMLSQRKKRLGKNDQN